MVILAINPGSTSTKIAIYHSEHLSKENLPWDNPSMPLKEQIEPRLNQIKQWLAGKGIPIQQLTAVVGRGGLLKPIKSGTYKVDQAMVGDALAGKRGVHPSNLGPILASRFAQELSIPAFVVDPVSVDELEPIAKVTGFPGITRDSFAHVLSIRAASRKAAVELGIDLADSSFVVAHIGGGISVAAVREGRIIDVNNANDEGPFSAERAGGLPFGSLLELCYSPQADQGALKKLILKESGLMGYLGTMDLREVVSSEDPQAKLIFKAMVYQIAKEIGAYATVLKGNMQALVLTGGMAHSSELIAELKSYVGFLGKFLIYPGEEEMEALVNGAKRVLEGKEQARTYREE